jgi:hypothetical protein
MSAPNDCGLPSTPTRIVLDHPDIAVGLPGDALADRADHAVACAPDPQGADDDQVVR